ncbi:GspH/FimT family pseudopilin [Lysobacter sp. HA35]
MRTKVNGFTLIEFIMTLAIVGLLTGIALPSLARVGAHTRIRTAADTLATHFASARFAAISRHTAVSVCPTADGATCRADGVWDGGWIVFEDPARSGRPNAVLTRSDPVGPRIHVRSSSARSLIRFLPNGSASGTNLTVELCGQSASRAIIVNNAGRARAEDSPQLHLCS